MGCLITIAGGAGGDCDPSPSPESLSFAPEAPKPEALEYVDI